MHPLLAVGFAVLLSLFVLFGGGWVRAHLVDFMKIPTASMSPTLLPGDHIVVDKRIGKLQDRKIKKRMIVAFISPNDAEITYVKRVVAVPGDRVEGVEMAADQFYLVGDGTDSFDSRHYGPISFANLVGTVSVVRFNLKDWSRFSLLVE